MKSLGNGATTGICILTALVSCVGCGAKVTIQLHPQPGEVRSFKTTATYSIEATTTGNKAQQTAANVMGITTLCEGVDPSGTATMKATIDGIDVAGIVALSGLVGRTADEAGKLSGKDLDLIGKSFSMKVSPLGQVEEVKGMSEIVAEIAKKAGETADKAIEGLALPPKVVEMTRGIAKTIDSQLQGTFGDNAMRETIGDLMAMYPDHPVRVGDSWTKDVVRSYGAMPMKRSETWTFTGRKDGQLTLWVYSKVTPNPDATPTLLGEMARVKIEYTGDASGMVELDETTGWIVKSDITSQLDGTITIRAMGGDGEPIPVKINVSAHVESAKKTD
jgi:hypothetical protein